MDNYLKTLTRVRWRLLGFKNVVGVGVGYKHVGMSRTERPAIIVFVSKKEAPENLSREQTVPIKINGLETDVIEIGEVRFLEERTQLVRPAQPGISIGHYRITAGTFGAVVRDRHTGEKLILSNNHILANATSGNDGRAAIGDPILQPGEYDGGSKDDRIATLLRYIPIQKGEVPATCPVANGAARLANMFVHAVRPNYQLKFFKRGGAANIVDCAVARPLRPDLITEEILGLGLVQGVAEAKLGMKVVKSGRTSGITRGTVTAVGVTLDVKLDDNTSAHFSDQVVTDMKSQGGDSGSLVLTEGNKAVGLLFAGSDRVTVFNHIQTVLDKLNVEF
ncbi:hypothetical protein Desca_0068 [Desulfotomaculum nigrificans CO-1-SRB]|uniref:Nal1 N-terminal domain-containing protein n=1 Tax=Desulfotomaculum nigrificans (strain DSM 14880 / VKM B-2319 / CO-1-SRB) TaxID=868595 RepID=F6B4F0_DESCC|nr:hypothetical protein [Desulfotomaculum nigrificans]AEF92973.1 hypothetical protein Desca_0068 [Desulfotomaculum nigrificans CO-1-SRB]